MCSFVRITQENFAFAAFSWVIFYLLVFSVGFFCCFKLCAARQNALVDFLFALAGKLPEEVRHTCKKHHNAVYNGVEEQKQDFGVQALFGVRNSICGLYVPDDRAVQQNERRDCTGDCAAD